MERVKAAAEVLEEIQSAPDQGIPEEILVWVECVAVVPSILNGGLVVAARAPNTESCGPCPTSYPIA